MLQRFSEVPVRLGMAISSFTPKNPLLWTFLTLNFNLGIAKMSVVPENPVQWTPLNRATSGPTLYVSNKRLELLSGGLI